MALCRVCGYCTGLCPVFPALERRSDLLSGDLDYLANLCHNCRACWYACQYAPPHPFGVNVPTALARQRAASYRRYLWPRNLSGPMAANARVSLAVSLAASLLVPLLTVLFVPAEQLFGQQRGPGAFYAIVPWEIMTATAALTLGWSLLALMVATIRFWRGTAPERPPAPLRAALLPAVRDILTLRHLTGGGAGCNDRDESLVQRRRLFHLALSYGFLSCLAATALAAAYHHLLAWPAPYPILSAPVLLGTIGGLAMLVGTAGLWRIKLGADPEPTAVETLAGDYVLLGQLFAIAASGLVLLVLRDTAAMGLLLAVHLGTVLALFVTLTHGKLVHGAYRAAALLRWAGERD